MPTILSPAQIESVAKALSGPESDALIDLVFQLSCGQAPDATAASAIPLARQLEWLNPGPGVQLTELGYLVADPLREYRFWLQRNRQIHGEKYHPHLAPERYAGKEVLEVGSGFGCNLLSLALRVEGTFVGVEPMAIYRQFTPLLAEREGLPAPTTVEGTGEALPFSDASFDTVLCYSSHQYMDIQKALREMARVLRHGGQLQIIGGTLASYSQGLWRLVRTRPTASAVLHGAKTLTNTLSYQWLGRRLWTPASVFTTSAPIYPARSAMCTWLTQAGLSLRDDLIQSVDSETCFVADKPSLADAGTQRRPHQTSDAGDDASP